MGKETKVDKIQMLLYEFSDDTLDAIYSALVNMKYRDSSPSYRTRTDVRCDQPRNRKKGTNEKGNN